MRERLSPEAQEFILNHHIHTINFEGRTVSIDDPSVADDVSLANHFNGVVNNLRSIELSGQKPQNIANYKGDVTPSETHLNFDHTTFSINRTDKNELLTQTTIGKVHSNGWPETELDINKVRKSLMISKQGNESVTAWFDNVNSPQLFNGKLSQIVVNSKLGSVFQLTTDSQNIIQSAFTGIKGALTLERMKDDLSSMEIAFTPTTPVFLSFIQGMRNFLTDKGINLQNESWVNQLFESVFSPRATPDTRKNFFRSIGIDEQTMKTSGISVLDTLYSADFPLNMDMAVQLMGAYRMILDITQDPGRMQALLSEANSKGMMFNSQIPYESIPVPADDAGQKLREVTNSILQREVLLPFTIPQLHIVQVRQGTQVKQVLVARYAANDTSTLNSFATTVMPGENVEYISDVSSTDPMDVFGYGLFNDYDKQSLQMKFKSVGNSQYTNQDPASWSTDNKLYGWTVDTAAGVLEARQDATRIYYDPAANGSRLFTGIEIPSSKGEGKIAELRPGSMKSKKYTNRVQSANRSVWFLGDYPYSVSGCY